MPKAWQYLVIGGVAAVVTFAATPFVVRLARARGWEVEPSERRSHVVRTPHVGGLAMILGVLAALLVARLWNAFDPLFARNGEPRGVLIAVVVMFLVGFIDDVHELSAPAKVFGTVVVGVVLVVYGVTMYYFRLPYLDVVVLSDDWKPLVTVVWLLGMTQAINLIDGLDGLAAGIVAIAAGAFFVYSWRLSDEQLLTPPNVGPIVAIIALGVCIGFLPHNFHPAKVFMGDGGSLLLGLLMAIATSVVGGRADPTAQRYAGQSYFFLAPLVIPLVILGVPVVDTLFAIVRRATAGSGVATADKRHLHHRLIEMGHGTTRAVLILWTWTALLSAFVLYPVLTQRSFALVPIGAGMLLLALFTVLHPEIRRNRSDATDATGATDAADRTQPTARRGRTNPS